MYFNTSLEERTFAFRDRCSRLVELNESIKLPGKGSLSAFEFDEQIGNNVASFEGDISLEGKTLKYSQKVTLSKRIYEAEDWEAFRKSVENQQKFATTPLIIELSN